MEAKASFNNEPLKAAAKLSAGSAGGVSGEYYTKAETTDLLKKKGDKTAVDKNTADIKTAGEAIKALQDKEIKIAEGDKILSLEEDGTLSSEANLELVNNEIVLKGKLGGVISSVPTSGINKGAIDEARTIATNASSKADTNSKQIDKLGTDTKALSSSVEGIEKRVKTNEDDIATLQGYINGSYVKQVDLNEYEPTEGAIVQHIGEENESYTKGFFYEAKSVPVEKPQEEGESIVVYELQWVRKDVQPQGSDITLDDSVTEDSPNGVKSSGIYSFIQPTAQQVKQNKTDIANNAKTIGLLSKETEANAADIEELKKRKTAEWGNIGGDISSQTDLQAALNAKQDSIAGSGAGSTALGVGTIASAPYQIALGRYNVEDTEGRFALIVGNGTSDENRSNAFCVTWDGEIVSDDMNSLVRNLGGVTGITAVSDVPEQQENGVLYVITA